ncbi:type II secretion system protein XpsH [Cognatilysobacter lacus]|uniref:Type II secretion system protein H n=1 Tax=Cognatilysobacter lacus TaxID=1643323 RepID=A0A5D8Z9B6_9GAMM|nr:GspH/FimT family pseudopilin [Lysobacter lacus]TZF91247.1 type II secretion system protein GspH [Lysobacter lacus]
MNRRARPTASPAAGRARGVSLIEIVIVITLIAIISLLAAAAMTGGFKGMQLRSAAKDVASQLRFTRTRAITSGQTQRFVIDPAAHAWRAVDRHGDIPDTLHVTFTGARELQPKPGEGAILFFADGASTGGRVQLSRDTAAWNVDVAWLTGEVKLTRAGGAP